MINKCYICKKELSKKELSSTHYCLCDATICSDCIETVMINENYWKCPKCGEKNNIGKTKLFREKKE